MAQEWYYAKQGTIFGPVTLQKLAELSDQGAIGPVELVWNKRMTQWAPAGSIQGLFANAFTPPLPPPLPIPPPLPVPPPLPLMTKESAVEPTGLVQTLQTVSPSLPETQRSRRFGLQSKWVLMSWSAMCLIGLVWGQTSVPASTAPTASFASMPDLPTWCVLWSVIGLPALVVWFLKK